MLYLMHLPKDIQSRIPYIGISSSALGENPNYLSAGGLLDFAYEELD